MKYAIFDLDGCLSDDRWRRGMLPNEQKKKELGEAAWDEYHSNAIHDTARNLGFVEAEIKKGNTIAFVTSRPVKFRTDTIAWVKRNVKPVKEGSLWYLYMRPSGDFRKSPQLKEVLCRNHLGWDRIVSAYDDRGDIVSMYGDHDVNATLLRVEDCTPRIGAKALQSAAAAGIGCMAKAAKAAAEFEENTAKMSAMIKASEGERVFPTTGTPRHLNFGCLTPVLDPFGESLEPGGVPEILEAMAETFRERNAEYKDNYKLVAPVIQDLFPEGVGNDLVALDRWHLFELVIVKLTRFARSGLSHKDSIRDIAVYAAMIEKDIMDNE